MRVGWIGTGVMGAPMCGHLLASGCEVTVHTRTRERAKALLEDGAAWADSPATVIQDAEVVFTMLGFPSDVHEVYFGERGLLEAAPAGRILVDMTTTRPQLARDISEAARARGCRALDAPVSGGDVGARNASLSIMVGGDEEALGHVRPLLERLGRQIVHQGPAGAGQDTKLCNQIAIAGTMIGVCESLLYGRRAGLDLEQMLTSIRGGAAGCWTLEQLAPRVLRRDFAPGFLVEHFIKDMGLALEECERAGLALPGLALVHQLYVALRSQGHGRAGTHALILALERLSASAA